MSTTRAAMTSAQIIGRASAGTESVIAFNISSKVAAPCLGDQLSPVNAKSPRALRPSHLERSRSCDD
jgi:hypothetical protein